MNRITMQDFSFSNGVTVSSGTTIQAVGSPLHRDPSVYENANDFEPLRFYKMAKNGGSHTQFTDTSPDLLGFGLGRHAW